MAVHAEQRHVVCRLRLQEAVITETKHVGEVRMEEHLGGAISLNGVILGESQQVVLAEDNQA